VNFIRSIIVFIQLSSSRNRTQARDLLLPFIFVTSPCLIRFDRDRANRLRDAVTLGRSSLYIHVTATKIVTKINSHENTNTSRFHRFCCCAAEATSSRSSTCICDRESRSPESSSSAILHHRKRANKIFGKRSSRLLTRFIKFFTTARLPLCRSRADDHRLQRELCQDDRRLHPVVIVKEPQVLYGSCSQIMSYIFNMLICVGMILLDNLLQCFLFIAMIDLSRTCGTATSLICYALAIFMIYSWIKIKPKVLIYLFSSERSKYTRTHSNYLIKLTRL
jgi:hypothetical protein